jgi:lactoylglutathione lyase
MLKKIDCVMIRVEDVKAAMAYYADVFGLQPVWWDESSAGLVFPESGAEIVVHYYPDIPSRVEVNYLVENVISAVQTLETKGCRILIEPFDIAIGKCAVIEDPFGTELCILDMTKGACRLGSQ